jgi:hypothetical protein
VQTNAKNVELQENLSEKNEIIETLQEQVKEARMSEFLMKEYVALVKSVSYIWKILKLSSRNHL